MANSHIQHVLLVTMSIVVVCLGYQDEPPSFGDMTYSNGSGPKVLQNPADFAFAPTINDLSTARSTLTCLAKNAKDVKWQYRQTPDAEFTDDVPANFQLTVTDGGEPFSKMAKLAELSSNNRPQMSGYYRCIGINDGYKALSPTVRLIVPELKIVNGKIENAKPQPEPQVGSSYKLPCLRPEEALLVPADAVDYVGVKSRWHEPTTGVQVDPTSDGRVRKDPKTGDLYYAYLEASDAFPNTQQKRLRCDLTLFDNPDAVTTNDVDFTLIASSQAQIDAEVLYPKTAQEKKVTCREGTYCYILCVFGGRKAVKTIGGVRLEPRSGVPAEVRTNDTTSTGFRFKALASSTPQTYECALYNQNNPSEVFASVDIEVTVLAYPKAVAELLPEPFQPSGKNNFEIFCDSQYVLEKGGSITFYVNGMKVTETSHDWISYAPSDPSKLTIRKTEVSQTNNFLCEMTNSAGSRSISSNLIVYDPPVLVQFPEAGSAHVITTKSNQNATDLMKTSTCNVTLDSKADSDPIVYWMSNRTNERITAKNIDVGIKAVNILINKNPTRIYSEITLELDPNTDKFLRDTTWHCVVDYKILGKSFTVKSVANSFQINAAPVPQPLKEAWPHYPVVFGAIGGFLFLVLLIVLIHCYVQKNSGEQYYVDKKERKAGHNPEEEMEAYGFSDYNRPDQNPVKGSRASMNFSDKPMESDTGSLDEYGDIDPRQFNDDGSFIGQYNGQPQHRHQADV